METTQANWRVRNNQKAFYQSYLFYQTLGNTGELPKQIRLLRFLAKKTVMNVFTFPRTQPWQKVNVIYVPILSYMPLPS